MARGRGIPLRRRLRLGAHRTARPSPLPQASRDARSAALRRPWPSRCPRSRSGSERHRGETAEQLRAVLASGQPARVADGTAALLPRGVRPRPRELRDAPCEGMQAGRRRRGPPAPHGGPWPGPPRAPRGRFPQVHAAPRPLGRRAAVTGHSATFGGPRDTSHWPAPHTRSAATRHCARPAGRGRAVPGLPGLRRRIPGPPPRRRRDHPGPQDCPERGLDPVGRDPDDRSLDSYGTPVSAPTCPSGAEEVVDAAHEAGLTSSVAYIRFAVCLHASGPGRPRPAG